ncbi:MAG: hypothetical protein QW524_00800 [Candidatus Woesearchaeota archaeon]
MNKPQYSSSTGLFTDTPKPKMKKRPVEITLLGVLNIIVSIIYLGLALLFLITGKLIAPTLSTEEGGPILTALGNYGAIILLVLGVLSIIIGIGLLKGKNYARIITMILVVLGLISGVPGLIITLILKNTTAILSVTALIVINILILLDLALRKEVKEFFKR